LGSNFVVGYSWLETLETFTINEKKEFMKFFHEKKKVTIHDLSVRVPP